MQFTIAAILTLAGSALAQTPGFNPLTAPTMNEVIPAGKPYAIKWTPQGGNGAPVSLYAYAGESASTLQEISTIATGVEASLGRFEWNIDAAIGGKFKAYGIKIALASNKETYQWSNPFTISAAEGSSSASSSSSSSPATTTASTSSSAATSKTEDASVTTTKPTLSSTTIPTTSSSTSITIPIGNLSTSAVGTGGATTQVTLVTSTSRTSSAGGSATSPATVPTGGAVAKGASSIAIVGGLAMAVLAL